jgi:hypothetical protein
MPEVEGGDDGGPGLAASGGERKRGEGELGRAVKMGRKEIGPAEPFWSERRVGPRVQLGHGLEKKGKGRERGLESFLFFKSFETFLTFKI